MTLPWRQPDDDARALRQQWPLKKRHQQVLPPQATCLCAALLDCQELGSRHSRAHWPTHRLRRRLMRTQARLVPVLVPGRHRRATQREPTALWSSATTMWRPS